MIAPNEFWLYLHRLAEAYEAEGFNTEDRAANIVSQFLDMPPVAQRHVLSDLVLVATTIPNLYPHVMDASNQAESERRQAQRDKAG
jgi:hypothetical protein